MLKIILVKTCILCVCVCVCEPQIYILSFNKLVSYKVLIGYMNRQVAFSGSDVAQYLEL